MLILITWEVVRVFAQQSQALRPLELIVVLYHKFHVKFFNILDAFKQTLVLQTLDALT